jgi:hypothetical protein
MMECLGIGKDLEGSVRVLNGIARGYLPPANKETVQNPSVSIVDAPSEIRTGNLPEK